MSTPPPDGSHRPASGVVWKHREEFVEAPICDVAAACTARRRGSAFDPLSRDDGHPHRVLHPHGRDHPVRLVHVGSRRRRDRSALHRRGPRERQCERAPNGCREPRARPARGADRRQLQPPTRTRLRSSGSRRRTRSRNDATTRTAARDRSAHGVLRAPAAADCSRAGCRAPAAGGSSGAIPRSTPPIAARSGSRATSIATILRDYLAARDFPVSVAPLHAGGGGGEFREPRHGAAARCAGRPTSRSPSCSRSRARSCRTGSSPATRAAREQLALVAQNYDAQPVPLERGHPARRRAGGRRRVASGRSSRASTSPRAGARAQPPARRHRGLRSARAVPSGGRAGAADRPRLGAARRGPAPPRRRSRAARG